MTYPLEPGKPEDYPVHPGSMLLTLVEPHKGYEVAFNRWYERDHFYGGCMEGEFTLAGARWVATRDLKDIRFPKQTDAAVPHYDSGSYVAVYWILDGHHDEWMAWSGKRVFDLYSGGRGFAERSHVNTNLYNFLGADYRDEDPVPVTLALDRHYQDMTILWFDGLDGKGGMLAMVHPNETIIDHTRGQTAGTTVQIGQMVFPGVTNERQAREATGAAARSLSRIAGAGQRYS